MTYHIGIDEAGRGPLAGPVAVGLVRVPEKADLLNAFPGLNDSKKLTEKARERLFALLEERARAGDIAYAVEFRSAENIDEKGIAVVIRDAIASGLEKLCGQAEGALPEKVWLDGALAAPPAYSQETVIGGDGLVPAIMLASVAAKVMRDRRMREAHLAHPEYGFDRHKGYGTSAHYEALRTYGLCNLHRRTFVHLD